MFQLLIIRPSQIPVAHSGASAAENTFSTPRLCALQGLPLVVAILDTSGRLEPHSSLYLTEISLSSCSVLGDTVLSYARSLQQWLNFLYSGSIRIEEATERDLQVFRNAVWTQRQPDGRSISISRSTVIARVETARRFHEWAVRQQHFLSPLGERANAQTQKAASSGKTGKARFTTHGLTLPVASRIPRVLTPKELKDLIDTAPMPYSLMFRWAVTSGLRRFELCKLPVGMLAAVRPTHSHMGVSGLDVNRKGGRLTAVYVPTKLLDETKWYMRMTRPAPRPSCEGFLFLTQEGFSVQRETVSRVFKRCADALQIRATFHHLRHTFAVTALQILQQQANLGSSINPLKTLQLLMGHANLTSTEVYLRALDLYSDEVAEALDFLYGSSL